MASQNQQITYTFSGAKETEDVSAINTVLIRRMDGSGGGSGGSGGQIISATADVSNYSTLDIFVGEGGEDGGSGGFGRSIGGDSGGIASSGGGSTEVVAESNLVAAADAGGGRGDDPNSTGGGGGARGGDGGSGGGTGVGDDAEGVGFGGDGGGGKGGGVEGKPGGQELGLATLTPTGSTTKAGGPGAEKNGEIVLGFDKALPPTINSLVEDISGLEPSVTVDFSSAIGLERTNIIHRSDASSPTFPADFTEVDSVGKGVTSFTDSPPDFETTFTYRVTASVRGNESDPSAPATITTSAGGELVVTITNTNSPVTLGDTIELDVDVENVGDYRADEIIDADLELQ